MNKFIKNNAVLLAVIIILFIIIIHNNVIIYKIYSNQIEGLWMAPESFCKQSDIDGMLVYVGPRINSSLLSCEKRKICLIIHGNNTTIAYKKIEISMTSPLSMIISPFSNKSVWSRMAKIKDVTLEVADPEIDIMDESDDVTTIPLNKIIPNCLNIMINLNEGKMVWTGEEDEVTYAELYKDNASSAIGKNLTEAHDNTIDINAQLPEL